MSLPLLKAPFFLPPRSGENNGVDFLGLRQVNLDMMAEMIPSINNVTNYIRPFSLLAWIYWKFHELCVENGVLEPSSEDLQFFRERIEVLFTWGASLHETPGRIPGTSAIPPPAVKGLRPLTFNDWGRVQSSTSLVAALWYGPASKAVTGLGFLLPVPGQGGFFRVTGAGITLARALDERLTSDPERYARLLGTLGAVEASEDDAVALWSLWSPETVTPEEKDAFASSLYVKGKAGERSTLLGKRSGTLDLAMLHLAKSDSPQSPSDIRQGMFLSKNSEGKVYEVPDHLFQTRDKWLVLQMRQLQRLSMESLLSWCEKRIIDIGEASVTDMARAFAKGWNGEDFGFSENSSLDELISILEGEAETKEKFLKSVRSGRLPTPFSIMQDIQALFRASDPAFAYPSFYGLLLCTAFIGALEGAGEMARIGGAPRLSLSNLRRRLKSLGHISLIEAIEYIMEAMIVSQHFSTAVNRFDGKNQRLRLTIEETGLVSLVSNPWEPTVTPDRLPTLLALATQCGLIGSTSEGDYYGL